MKENESITPEVRERAVRMLLKHGGYHAPQWRDQFDCFETGCTGETWREGCSRERDQGKPPCLMSDERERMKVLEWEYRELWQVDENPAQASAYFSQAELDRRSKPWFRSLTVIAP